MIKQLQAQIEQKRKELAELEARMEEMNKKPSPEERLLQILKTCIKITVTDEGWVWYNSDGEWLLELINSTLWVRYLLIWKVFEKGYYMEYEETQQLVRVVMEKHFKVNGVIPIAMSGRLKERWKSISK